MWKSVRLNILGFFFCCCFDITLFGSSVYMCDILAVNIKRESFFRIKTNQCVCEITL